MQNLPNIVTKTFTQDQIEAIDQLYFKNKVSPQDRLYCYCVAATLNLNPILGEIMFLGRRQKIAGKWIDKTEPMVGRDGYLAIAHRSNQFDGIEVATTIKEMPLIKDGIWGTANMLVASCKVWRKGFSRPFVVEVNYNEYVQTDRSGNPTTFWLEKADLMLRKVAESQALRKAFDIHGTYSPEEIGIGTINTAGKLEYDRHAQATPVTIQLISQSEIDEIEDLVTRSQADRQKMLDYFNVTSITDMSPTLYAKASSMLRAKLAKIILNSLAKRGVPAVVAGDGSVIARPNSSDNAATSLLKEFGFCQSGNACWKLAANA